MPIRTRKNPQQSTSQKTESSDKLPHGDHKSSEELKSDMDNLLDEIDDVLVENAAEFVADFIQGNGE